MIKGKPEKNFKNRKRKVWYLDSDERHWDGWSSGFPVFFFYVCRCSVEDQSISQLGATLFSSCWLIYVRKYWLRHFGFTEIFVNWQRKILLLFRYLTLLSLLIDKVLHESGICFLMFFVYMALWRSLQSLLMVKAFLVYFSLNFLTFFTLILWLIIYT